MSRIFIVEDEAIVALELKDHLRGLGYEICGHATKGDRAFEAIVKTRPDLVLMDINLGAGLSGLDVAKQLHGALDVPVIFLTAYSDEAISRQAGQSAGFAYVVKPYDPRVLGANIELALTRRRAEAALLESEERFRRVVDHISDALIVDDLEGKVVFANDRFLELFGIARERLATLRLEDYVAPACRARLRDQHDRRMAGEAVPTDFEYEGLRRDGSPIWIEVSVVPLRDPSGALIGTQSAMRDIGERKRAEVALLKSEGQLRESQRLAGVGSWEWDLAGNTTTWSENLYGIFGVTAEWFASAAGEDFQMLVHPEDRDRVWRVMQAALDTDEPFEVQYRIVRPDGSERHVDARGNVVRDADGKAVTMRGSSQDVTEWKRREEQLALAQFTIENAGDAFHLVDNNARLLEVNEASCRLLGYSRAELQSMTIHDIVPALPPDAWLRHREEIKRLGSYSRESAVRRKTGELVPVEVTMNTLTFGGREYQFAVLRDIRERRRAETALRDSEERYRRLFTEAMEGIFRTKLDGTVLDANPAFCRLLGYDSPKDLVGTNLLSHYADPEARRKILERHGGQDDMNGAVVRWRTRAGELLDVEVNGRLLRDDTGQPVLYQGFVRDVSAQLQHDAALRVLSTDLARLTGAAFFTEVAKRLAGILDADISFINTFSPAVAPVCHSLAFVVEGKAIPTAERRLEGTPCEQVLAGEVQVFSANVRQQFPRDGFLAELAVEGYIAAPLLDAGGRVIGHIGIMTRKQLFHTERAESVVRLFALRTAAELERQRAETRFTSVVESAPDALLIVDPSGRIVLANHMAEHILGYGREEVLRLKVEDLVPEANRSAHVFSRAEFLGEGRTRRMVSSRDRLWVIHKDGHLVPVEINLSPLLSEEGRLVVAAIRDVSARVRMEEESARLKDQLAQAQRMKSLGTLAGGIAHDFNNLLTVILGSLELARMDIADIARPDSVSERLDEVAAAAVRASELVKQILVFSRQQPSVRSIASARAVVEETARLLRATLPTDIRIVTKMGEDAYSILIDSTQIHRVLMNLGTNAWHAIERPTGTITFGLDAVSVEPETSIAESVGVGRYVRIRVSDDGGGMTAETLDRIFEPFFTTKEVGKGTGLGLAVVHGIVLDHGGVITVDSELGRGTTFTILLPEGAKETGLPEVQAELPRRGGAHVLLVDDEESLLRIGELLLRQLGHQVTCFSRPLDALDAFRSDLRQFDVVITDLNMPQMGGLDVARAIAALRPDLPIVLVSGNVTHSEEQLAKAGVRLCVDKPYTSASLGRALDRVLDRTEAR